jgi:hypothetical protein
MEGFIVDTDHWRHFFLILGLVWGLTAASINLRRGYQAGNIILVGAGQNAAF